MLGVVEGTKPDTILDKFIERSVDYWDIILSKREDMLLSSILIIFRDLPEEQVQSVSNLFSAKDSKGNSLITNDKREVIWNYVWSFVKIAIKHVHCTRQPLVNEQGIKKYTVDYFPGISVKNNAEKWQIKVDE